MKNKKNAGRVKKSVLELMPERSYDERNACFCLEDGTYMDLWQIRSKDLINASEDEVEFDCMKFAKTYRLYADDLKIVCLNFPCDYTRQKKFLEYKIRNTKNQIFKELLEKKLKELVWLEKNDTTREYYYMIFGNTVEGLKKNILTLTSGFGTGRSGLIGKITEEKKTEILFRLRNKSILVHG